MNKLLVMCLLVVFIASCTQKLSTNTTSVNDFSVGTKFSIKLIPIDSVNYKYEVITSEKLDTVINTEDYDHLFNTYGENGTITFLFCIGTFGINELERKQNEHVILVWKNYSKNTIAYTSKIQRKENGVFEPSPNTGILPSTIGREMWPYMVNKLSIENLKKLY